MAEKRKNEKLSIEEYQARKALLSKKRFRIEAYPWPVLLALGLPFATFIFLIIVYFLHIRGVAA
ncbi:MAG: hypothetical protein HQL20_08760 [Candidatus Omnitrophica bacterium]|nr:hypothetical protein [Candidatus Omnitrophota bacterium]